jgi:hypothetical protein
LAHIFLLSEFIGMNRRVSLSLKIFQTKITMLDEIVKTGISGSERGHGPRKETVFREPKGYGDSEIFS